MSPVAHLVGLLPAAGLGVHVYGVFCPVSLSVELFCNLRMRQGEAKGQSDGVEPGGGKNKPQLGGSRAWDSISVQSQRRQGDCRCLSLSSVSIKNQPQTV